MNNFFLTDKMNKIECFFEFSNRMKIEALSQNNKALPLRCSASLLVGYMNPMRCTNGYASLKEGIVQIGEVSVGIVNTPLNLEFTEIFRRKAFQIIGPFFALFARI
jgi:hypothetical protein